MSYRIINNNKKLSDNGEYRILKNMVRSENMGLINKQRLGDILVQSNKITQEKCMKQNILTEDEIMIINPKMRCFYGQ